MKLWDVDVTATREDLKKIGMISSTDILLDKNQTFLGYFDTMKMNGSKVEVFKFKDQRLPEICWVLREHVALSIVRDNLMNQKSYTGYCGVNKKCSGGWPRTVFQWNIKQFKCKSCGWESKFNQDFIERYIQKWGFNDSTKFKPNPDR